MFICLSTPISTMNHQDKLEASLLLGSCSLHKKLYIPVLFNIHTTQPIVFHPQPQTTIMFLVVFVICLTYAFQVLMVKKQTNICIYKEILVTHIHTRMSVCTNSYIKKMITSHMADGKGQRGSFCSRQGL